MKTNFLKWLFTNKGGLVPMAAFIIMQILVFVFWQDFISRPKIAIGFEIFIALIFTTVVVERHIEYLKEGGKNG